MHVNSATYLRVWSSHMSDGGENMKGNIKQSIQPEKSVFRGRVET